MKLEHVILQGIRADQPLATDVAPGTVYGVTDEGDILERSDGTAWLAYSPAATGGGITELTGDVTATGPGVSATTIADGVVTFNKIQESAADSILVGRGDSAPGILEEITLGAGLAMAGTVLSATGGSGIDELTGDVTAGPGSGSEVATIANDAVTYAKMQNVSAASKLLGRGAGSGAGNVEEITLGTNLSMSGTTLNAAGGGGGGGGLVYLGIQTASGASPNLDFTSLIDSLYDVYQFELVNLVPANNNVELRMEVSVDNGATWETANYQWSMTYTFQTAIALATFSDATAANFLLCGGIANDANGGICGTVKLYNLLEATRGKSGHGMMLYLHDDGGHYEFKSSLWFNGAAVNAIRFFISSGNIASGDIRLYGYAKS